MLSGDPDGGDDGPRPKLRLYCGANDRSPAAVQANAIGGALRTSLGSILCPKPAPTDADVTIYHACDSFKHSVQQAWPLTGRRSRCVCAEDCSHSSILVISPGSSVLAIGACGFGIRADGCRASQLCYLLFAIEEAYDEGWAGVLLQGQAQTCDAASYTVTEVREQLLHRALDICQHSQRRYTWPFVQVAGRPLLACRSWSSNIMIVTHTLTESSAVDCSRIAQSSKSERHTY